MLKSNSTTVFSCGSSQFSQTLQPEISSIPANAIPNYHQVNSYSGGYHSVFIINKANVSSVGFCGCASEGQIPDASNDIIYDLYIPAEFSVDKHVKMCAAGDYFTIILYEDGRINGYGEIKIPDEFNNFKKVFAKFGLAFGVKDNDEVFALDCNNGNIFHLDFDECKHVLEVSSIGESGAAVLTDNGMLYLFKKLDDKCTAKINNVVSIASSRKLLIILKSDGRVYELHDDKLIQITGFEGLPIKVFAGGAHYGLITYDGNSWTWGCGTSGQLGNGYFFNLAKPQKVIINNDYKVINASAGEEHTLFDVCPSSDFSIILPDLMRKEELVNSYIMNEKLGISVKIPEFDLKF